MTNPNEQVVLAMAIKSMHENMPAWLELVELEALKTRTKYLALVKNGFNEFQALELCKKS